MGVIPSLHRVGQALKVDLDHLDRPAAMLGVFGAPADGEGGVPVDVSARLLHEKVIRRLGSRRSKWSLNDFLGAVTGALSDIAASYAGKFAPVSVCLVVGRTVVAASAPGARICLMSGPPSEFNPLPTKP